MKMKMLTFETHMKELCTTHSSQLAQIFAVSKGQYKSI